VTVLFELKTRCVAVQHSCAIGATLRPMMGTLRRRWVGLRRTVELTDGQADAVERHAHNRGLSADAALLDLLDRGIAEARP
jgi:hypothetical protein